jgi:hypothetical protein
VSIQDERELAERLGGLLDGVEPRPAPLAAAVRQGRGIRLRRRLTAVVGLAVIAAGAALVPAVLHSRAAPPPTAPRHRHYTVTVNHLPSHARKGVVASGTQDGRPWQVTMSGTASNSNVTFMNPLGPGPTPVGNSVIPQFTGEWGATAPAEAVGAVSPAVTDIQLILAGGKVIDLRPVWWSAHPYVGVELPPGASLVRAVEYAGERELAYYIPLPGSFSFDNWWRPGQVGPARYGGLIGSGVVNGSRWSVRAEIGPWGYCYVGTYSSTCLGSQPRRQVGPKVPIAGLLCTAYGINRGPDFGLDVTSDAVRRVQLRLSGGGTLTFPAVDADGSQLFGYVIPARQRVTSATGFSARGSIVWTIAGHSLEC